VLATDFVPFAGFRFGGSLDVAAATPAAAPSSLAIDGALSYGAVVDFPISTARSLELYYSRQPTTLSGPGAFTPAIRDVTVSVLQLGLVDSVPGEDSRLSWLLIGTLGATEFRAAGATDTRVSIGLGGGVVWMASQHVGLRGELRAVLSFGDNGNGFVSCGGGCTAVLHTTAVPQAELALGVVARF
jgi:hypothetical protein